MKETAYTEKGDKRTRRKRTSERDKQTKRAKHRKRQTKRRQCKETRTRQDGNRHPKRIHNQTKRCMKQSDEETLQRMQAKTERAQQTHACSETDIYIYIYAYVYVYISLRFIAAPWSCCEANLMLRGRPSIVTSDCRTFATSLIDLYVTKAKPLLSPKQQQPHLNKHHPHYAQPPATQHFNSKP